MILIRAFVLAVLVILVGSPAWAQEEKKNSIFLEGDIDAKLSDRFYNQSNVLGEDHYRLQRYDEFQVVKHFKAGARISFSEKCLVEGRISRGQVNTRDLDDWQVLDGDTRGRYLGTKGVVACRMPGFLEARFGAIATDVRRDVIIYGLVKPDHGEFERTFYTGPVFGIRFDPTKSMIGTDYPFLVRMHLDLYPFLYHKDSLSTEDSVLSHRNHGYELRLEFGGRIFDDHLEIFLTWTREMITARESTPSSHQVWQTPGIGIGYQF